MPLLRSSRRAPVTTTTKPSLMSRLMGPTRRSPRTHATTTTRAAPVHHQKRKPSIGDKISGAMLKIKGSLTRRPGQKAAGTKRMRGTDGRNSRRRHAVGTGSTTTTRRRRRVY